jgi:hypothetical protein
MVLQGRKVVVVVMREALGCFRWEEVGLERMVVEREMWQGCEMWVRVWPQEIMWVVVPLHILSFRSAFSLICFSLDKCGTRLRFSCAGMRVVEGKEGK